MARSTPGRIRATAHGLLLTGFALAPTGCVYLQPQVEAFCARHAPAPPPPEANDAALYRAASTDGRIHLEREVTRLQADLEQAEQQLVAIESGLRSAHTRADAVSAIGDARIAVERARRRAPWRSNEAADARAKLAEAERQLAAGHSGSAVFFASRALRIAANIDSEARQVEQNPNTRFVDAPRVNLREGPSTQHRVIGVLTAATPVFPERHVDDWLLVRTVSGTVGWVHDSLVRGR